MIYERRGGENKDVGKKEPKEHYADAIPTSGQVLLIDTILFPTFGFRNSVTGALFL